MSSTSKPRELVYVECLVLQHMRHDMASTQSISDHAKMYPSLILAGVIGLSIHLLYFRRFEHHMYGGSYVQLGASLIAGCTFWLARTYSIPLSAAFERVFCHAVALLTGLYSSLLAYRLFWHPLRRFPGPFGARISSLWLSTQLKNGNAHKKMLELHRQYGPFIRIGSSDLAISHPLGVPGVYGQGSPCRKASWYDEDWPRSSVHTTRDHAWHAQRRRVWSAAFSDKALRAYEERIRKYTASLEQQMSKLSGNPVNVAEWFKYFSFDVMGDLAFNKDFEMLAKGESHWAIALLNDALGLQGQKLPTWLFRMLLGIPGLAHKYWKFIGYCDQQLENRIRQESGENVDILASLLPSRKLTHQEQLSPQELLTLRSDTRTIIVAGSDTTASAITHVFYYLARDPLHIKILRDELEASSWNSDGETSHRNIQKAEYLNAVINETLRLHPAVSTAMTRKTPPEGIAVGNVPIPGSMTVWCPQWVLGRDENIYERADEFVPERWTTQPGMIKEKAAYAPFSTGAISLHEAVKSVESTLRCGLSFGYSCAHFRGRMLTGYSAIGPYGCIGRPLALMELRMVIATLITRFNIGFAPGENGRSLLEDSRDQFTLKLGDLFLIFEQRKP